VDGAQKRTILMFDRPGSRASAIACLQAREQELAGLHASWQATEAAYAIGCGKAVSGVVRLMEAYGFDLIATYKLT
jgi:hypothetical protein